MFRNALLTTIFIFCVIGSLAAADTSASGGSSPVTLTIITPYDQDLNTGLKTIAQEYGKDHNTIINIVSVQGRKKIVEELTSGNTSADLVVIEKEYPVFNLKGLTSLEKKGLIDKSEELYKAEADLIVSPKSTIKSVQDLNGTTYAAVDLVNYHMPGGCLANSVMATLPAKPTVVNQSGIKAIYEAVANSSADATILWKSDYTNQKKDQGDLKAIPIPDYSMDNYIATLKNSVNAAEAASFMDFVLAHKDELSG
jgi:ABC-type molybdate transport system substrate-binding protein